MAELLTLRFLDNDTLASSRNRHGAAVSGGGGAVNRTRQSRERIAHGTRIGGSSRLIASSSGDGTLARQRHRGKEENVLRTHYGLRYILDRPASGDYITHGALVAVVAPIVHACRARTYMHAYYALQLYEAFNRPCIAAAPRRRRSAAGACAPRVRPHP